MSYRIRSKLGRVAVWTATGKAPQNSAVAGASKTGDTSGSADRLNVREDCNLSVKNSSRSSSHGAITEYVNGVERNLAGAHGMLDGVSDAPDFSHLLEESTAGGSNQKENRPLGQRIRQFVARVSGLSTPKEKHSSPMDGDGGSMPGDELFSPSLNFAKSRSRLSCDSSPDLSHGRSEAWYQSGRGTVSDRGKHDSVFPKHRNATRLYRTSGNESANGSETSSKEYRRMSTATIIGRAGAMPNRSDTQSRFIEEFDVLPSSLPGAPAPSDSQETETAFSSSTNDLVVESPLGTNTVDTTRSPGHAERLGFAHKAYSYLGRTHDWDDTADLEAKAEISKKDLDRILFTCLVNHSPFEMRVQGKPEERLHCKILYSQWQTKMPTINRLDTILAVPPTFLDCFVARDTRKLILEILRLRENNIQLNADNALLRSDNACLEQQKHALTVQARNKWLGDLGSSGLPFAETVRAASKFDEGVDTGTDNVTSWAEEITVQSTSTAQPWEVL
ncbi:MAG: hypothetical protein M1836_001858 [Candelina mexicana]|nr:MAG: hypothetical protein M1836_001858 [Candelina mexicana]